MSEEEVKRKKIFEAAELPEDTKVYLKKDMFGWRIVNPIKNPDGTINWVNLLVGGWRNLAILIILLAVLSFLIYSHYHDISVIKEACNVSQALQFKIATP